MLKAALVLSVMLQFGAFIMVVSLIRKTRYNISWIMLSVGFMLMAVRRLYELLDVLLINTGTPVNSWLAVAISIAMFTGSAYIRKIFSLQNKIEQIRRENEAQVLTAIVQTEEKERKSFARELHDGLGPLLSSVKMSLSALRDKSDKKGESLIANSYKAVEQAINSLREISNKLSPHALEDFGLEKAIRSYSDVVSKIDDFEFNFNSNLQGRRFSSDTELVLYRIAGELINNAIKHAKARKAEINLLDNKTHLEMSYTDNGKGFNPDAPTDGLGLSSIKSRVLSLDGRINIHSQPGQGCFVNVFIPINYD